jgi:anaerobic magnesium-protoporphyrin IX monomethyl ester cyclase
MRVLLVSVASTFSSFGFRKIAAAVRNHYPECHAYYVMPDNSYSPINLIFPGRKKDKPDFSPADFRKMAETLAEADVVGFSSMSDQAENTKKIIQELRLINPKVFIVWGGIHAILAPEDAIKHADGVCTGEGDFAFLEFLQKFSSGADYSQTENFWFHNGEAIIKNSHRPLLTSEEMNTTPHPLYGEAEYIFQPDSGFQPVTDKDYVTFNGLCYNTLWTQGCPYKCTYCGNSALLELDSNYAKIRHASVDHIIAEVLHVRAKYPFIDTVLFHDDSFLGLPLEVLREFSLKWREQVGISFAFGGVTPFYVNREKLDLLLLAGMTRIRMGIQSGSSRTLRFFKRPNKPGMVLKSTRIINEFTPYMIPPTFDIIVDIPVDEPQDMRETLQLLYDMPRPYDLNVYSLRSIPKTELEKQLQEKELDIGKIDTGYFVISPTLANVLVFFTPVFRLPKPVFNALLMRIQPAKEATHYPVLLFLCRFLALVKRGLHHLWFMDFSLTPGPTGYWLWRFGVIGFWAKHVRKRYLKKD